MDARPDEVMATGVARWSAWNVAHPRCRGARVRDQGERQRPRLAVERQPDVLALGNAAIAALAEQAAVRVVVVVHSTQARRQILEDPAAKGVVGVAGLERAVPVDLDQPAGGVVGQVEGPGAIRSAQTKLLL
jgi:hypothetical protein